MKTVLKQLKLIKDLVNKFEEKLYDRSYWRERNRKRRIEEVKAIIKACETLIVLIKIADIELIKKPLLSESD